MITDLELIYQCFAGNKRQGAPARDEELVWSIESKRWQLALARLARLKLASSRGKRIWLLLEVNRHESWLHLVERKKEK